jgi:hypothetical protein
MESGSPPVQRRQYRRFKVQGGTVGVAKYQFIKMGQIKDISEGGLSFTYFDSGDSHDQIPDESELSISMDGKNFYIESVPFITKSDFKVKPDFLEIRQRCVQFGPISPSQEIHLEYILSNFTKE